MPRHAESHHGNRRVAGGSQCAFHMIIFEKGLVCGGSSYHSRRRQEHGLGAENASHASGQIAGMDLGVGIAQSPESLDDADVLQRLAECGQSIDDRAQGAAPAHGDRVTIVDHAQQIFGARRTQSLCNFVVFVVLVRFNYQGFPERELLLELPFEMRRSFPHRLNGDLDDAFFLRRADQPLHLLTRYSQTTADLELGKVVEEIELGDLDQQVVGDGIRRCGQLLRCGHLLNIEQTLLVCNPPAPVC